MGVRRSSSEESRRVCDDPVPVILANILVDNPSIDARGARPAFKVQKDVSTRDERSAAPKGALEVLGTMDGGVEVSVEVAGILEMPVAWLAIVMYRRLAEVLLEPVFVDKNLSAGGAIGVVVFIVNIEVLLVIEMYLAVLTVCVVGALDPMLL